MASRLISIQGDKRKMSPNVPGHWWGTTGTHSFRSVPFVPLSRPLQMCNQEKVMEYQIEGLAISFGEGGSYLQEGRAVVRTPPNVRIISLENY